VPPIDRHLYREDADLGIVEQVNGPLIVNGQGFDGEGTLDPEGIYIDAALGFVNYDRKLASQRTVLRPRARCNATAIC
jgi:hypothetical protein